MKRIAIIGAGDLGLQFHHFISYYSNDKIVGWFDDTKRIGTLISKVKVLGKIRDIPTKKDNFDFIIIAIGYRHLILKIKLLKQLQYLEIPLYTFIHPTAIVDKSAFIAPGCFVYPNVVIDQHVKIERGCVLNISTIISHDTHIKECNFLAPGCMISGFVKVGSCCFLGTGTIIIDSIEVCDHVQTGAGSVVIKNLEQAGLYVGNPVRKINKNDR